jgi:hypothetical protein
MPSSAAPRLPRRQKNSVQLLPITIATPAAAIQGTYFS